MDPAKRQAMLEKRIHELMAQRCILMTQIEMMQYEHDIGEARDVIFALHEVLKDQPKIEANVYEALHKTKPFSGLCLGDLYGVVDHCQNPYEVDQKNCPECGWCGCKTAPQRAGTGLGRGMPEHPSVDVMR
jgi:hypothetical protein